MSAAGDNTLNHRGSAYIAAYAGSAGGGVAYVVKVFHAVRYHHVAQTVAGDGEGLAVGIADDGIGIDVGHIGHLDIAVYQLAVGLVGDNVDGVAVLCALLGEQLCQPLKGLAGEYGAGGVVGGVDYHAAGVGGKNLLKLGEVDLELIHIGGHDNLLHSGAVDKAAVFGEEGSKAYGLAVVIHCECLYGGDEGSCGAAGDVEIAAGKGAAHALAEGLGDGVAGIIAAYGAGVAVHHQGGFGLDHIYKGLLQLLWRGNAGIAYAEIVYVFGANYGGLLLAVLKQLADAAAHTAVL